MKFQFQLEKILQLLDVQESVAKMDRMKTQNQIERMEKEKKDCESLMNLSTHQKPGVLSLPDLALQQAVAEAARKTYFALGNHLQKERKILEGKTEELQKITGKKNAIESLKKRKKGDFDTIQDQKEWKELEFLWMQYFHPTDSKEGETE